MQKLKRQPSLRVLADYEFVTALRDCLDLDPIPNGPRDLRSVKRNSVRVQAHQVHFTDGNRQVRAKARAR